MPTYLLVPLVASALFALASLFVKRAYASGAGPGQALHVINIVIALVFFPLPFFEDSAPRWDLWFQPALVGATFFGGTWFAALAIGRGDVSLVTPIGALKVVVVTVLVGLLTGEWPSATFWLAALIAAAGVMLVTDSHPGGGRGSANNRSAIAAMAFSVLLLGCGDVLIQKWAGGFGPFTFVTLAAASAAAYSLVAVAVAPKLYLRPPWTALAWLTAGGAVAGLQSVMMGLVLAFAGDAAGIHVVYSLRGIWAVVLAAVIGGRLGLADAAAISPPLFRGRVAGAILLAAAVTLATLSRS